MTRATAEARPAQPRRFEVDGLEITAMRYDGPADAPVIVLVHGIGMSGRYFGPLIPALAERVTVWTVDLPGYGRSRKPGRDVSIADHAGALAGFIEQAGLRRPMLAGHSMGTQVVSRLAADRPELVGSLVLMAPTMPPGQRTLLRGAARLFVDAFRNPPEANRVILADGVLRCGPLYFLRQTRHLFGDRPEVRMGRIQTPALVLGGRRDLLSPPWWVRRVADGMPHGRAELVPGPHVMMYRSPGALAELLIRFACS